MSYESSHSIWKCLGGGTASAGACADKFSGVFDVMNFETFESIWNCCPPPDATLANQLMIKDMQQVILDAIQSIPGGGGGGGDATQAKQDELLAEIEKLTKGVKTC